jgi:hypothetical protein
LGPSLSGRISKEQGEMRRDTVKRGEREKSTEIVPGVKQRGRLLSQTTREDVPLPVHHLDCTSSDEGRKKRKKKRLNDFTIGFPT